ncbi:MAG: hypothetical protein SO152_04380 [Ruminococcus sp.]|nr:hypothetical protein [Ruminococcus sp.]
MAVDGSLIFNTKIDVVGFDKGTKQLSSRAINLKNKISETERAIARLTSELNKLANTDVKSKTVESLEKSVESAKIRLSELEGKAENIFQNTRADLFDMGFDDSHLDSILEQNQEWKKLQEKIAKADEELLKYQRDLQQANATEKISGTTTQEYADKREKLAQLNNKLTVYKAQLSETQHKEKATSRHMAVNTDILKKFASAVKKLGSQAKKIFGNTVVKSVKSLGSHLKKLFSHTKKTNNQMSGLAKSINMIKQAIGGMLLYKVVQGGIESLKESLQEMAKVSPNVNKQLSALMTSFTYMKNTLATAFLPLLTVVTPILTRFMDTLSGVINKVAEFFSALTGQSTYVKAVKVQQDYAKSLDDTTKSTNANTKATKDNQKSLAGYDELNVMQSSESEKEKTDNSKATSPLYQTVAVPFNEFANKLKQAFNKGDYSGIAKIIAQRINSALAKINWKSIRQSAKKIASNIADFINGALKNINWNLLGQTVGNGIMTAVDFAYTLITEINWFLFGQSIANFLNGAVESIDFIEIGKLLGEIINSVFSFALGIATEFNWVALGESLREALKALFETLDIELVIEAVTSLINGVFLSAITLVGDPDFTELGTKTAKALKEMLNKINWENISSLFFKLITGIFDFVNGFVLEIDWKVVGDTLANSFNSFFGEGGLGYKSITSISNAFWNLLGGAITALDEVVENIDWEKLGDNILKTVKKALKEGGELLAKLSKIASKIVNELLKQLNKFFTDEETSKSVTNSIKKMFKNVDWSEIMVNALTLLVNAASWLVDTIGELVDDLTSAMADGFTHSENNQEIEKAIMELVKAIANLFISILNLALKLIVNIIPNLVLSLFRLIIEILDYIGSFVLGDEWYAGVKKDLAENFPVMDFDLQIPKLATGTVVPANYGEFAAILGDNKREPEVVSPLSTMKQAFKEALAEGSFGGSGDINLTINLDGEPIFKDIIRRNDREKKRFGKSVFA